MRLGRGTGAAVWGVIGCLGLMTAGAADLTYADLVGRLTDLEHLATRPVPGEQCRQWSSYDRASRVDEVTGRYLGWDANGDGEGILRREGGRLVLAEMSGPGCLWRIWSAAPKQGRVRIYLEGAAEAAVDLPFTGYFDGSAAPFDRAALVHTTALGWNNYTPIPFQTSCRIVAEEGWGQYYQFVYSTFPEGTRVPTFRRALTAAENAALDAADRALRECGPASAGPGGSEVRVGGVLGAGAEDTVRLVGPEAIVGIRARVSGLPDSPADRVALRELVLEIRWEGESEPSVWSPFGDFFGTAAGANRYRSLPCGLTEEGEWYANWVMPFQREARVTLRNEGREARTVEMRVLTRRPKVAVESLGRFHAKWHRDAFLPEDPARRAIDWTLLKTTGAGRFVGVMLHVWNPRGSWWGEGDEKFFVDGEAFPSTIGTGSEDYFGYAWCNPTLFQHAYHNQTLSMNNRGHISVNRWHIPDNIPFQTAFEGAIEKYFPNERPTLYAATVYWYQHGGRDPYRAVGVAERTGYWDESMVATRRVAGALEGERLRVVTRTGGEVQEQDMSGFGPEWSGDAQLWWTQAKPGDRLEWGVPVGAAGRYRLEGQFTRAVDYGIVQLTWDGRDLGAPIDGYHDGVVATGVLDLGELDLTAGEHRLGLRVVGANPRAVPAYMVGLDYLRLVPVR